ncbi:MAG TPA: hypothetical protein VGR20_03190 [Acidimicrobiia bacterium]|nr:hypothetical protein [Acidimicrobiia bacterium]
MKLIVMGEVDRRGFMRILRRSEPVAKEAEPPPPDPQTQELAELTLRLLADFEAENDEQLAEGSLLTKPFDLAYMRVTADRLAFSYVTGFSVVIQTKDVRAFDTDPPEEFAGYGGLILGILRAHHPADLETVTRSYAFRFRVDSPLLAAIRTACDIPEPEPEPEEAPTVADDA